MAEFKVIESQEQLDSIISDRINRAKESVRKEYSDYDDLKIQVAGFDGVKADYEKQLEEAKAKISEHDSVVNGLNTQIAELKSNNLKMMAAQKFGIPFEMAGRINGTDEESILKDAESIAPMFAQKGYRFQNWNSNENNNASKDEAYRKLISGIGKGE